MTIHTQRQLMSQCLRQARKLDTLALTLVLDNLMCTMDGLADRNMDDAPYFTLKLTQYRACDRVYKQRRRRQARESRCEYAL